MAIAFAEPDSSTFGKEFAELIVKEGALCSAINLSVAIRRPLTSEGLELNGRPQWQLPPGVSRGTWDYLQSKSIASEYDQYFAESPLMRLDEDLVKQHLPPVKANQDPPVIADLGCGTGRLSRALLPLGYHMLNIDLSEAMLRELVDKTPPEFATRCTCICANLVELEHHTEPRSIDMAACLFSSVGMIRGRKHRQRFLGAVQRSLKPSGKLLLHVHNRYHSVFDPGGIRWLVGGWLSSQFRKGGEFGDRVYPYRNLPSMFLHIYSRRELMADLRTAGFKHFETLPVASRGDRLLSRPGLFPNLRAGGFFATATA